jgi:mannose-1-phosphate guanylyltransferase
MEKLGTRQCWAIILAGGDGLRLQALTSEISGAPIPKQYCPMLAGGRSLLEAASLRAKRYATAGRTLVIVNRNHLNLCGAQLGAIPWRNVIVQPINRDTGPGMLLALLCLSRRDPYAMVTVFPSDHFIDDDRVFLAHVERGAEIAERLPEKIVLLGVPPDRVDTGFGYIEPRPTLHSKPAEGNMFRVAAFHEKPTAARARRLIRRGGLWNSFVMVFRLNRILELLREVQATTFGAMAGAVNEGSLALDRFYDGLQAWNFSNAFLAQIPQHLVVLRVDGFHWSNWGTPESIARSLQLLDLTPPWTTPSKVSAA